MGGNHHSAFYSMLLQFTQTEDLSFFHCLDILSLNNKKQNKEDINKGYRNLIDWAVIVCLSKKINTTLGYNQLGQNTRTIKIHKEQ